MKKVIKKNIYTWYLEYAVIFVQNLQGIAEKYGFHLGLAGSVLHRNKSEKDLDIIVYPHNTSDNPFINQVNFLKELRRFEYTKQRVRTYDHQKKTGDTKEVVKIEKYCGVDNVRYIIDLFFLS